MTSADIIFNLQSHVNHLAGTIGSRSLSEPDSLTRAADYIRSRFASLGYRMESEPFTAFGTPTENILALPRGWDPSRPAYLLGAHYDTVPLTPGADDNASGVAVTLEVARLLAGSGIACLFAAFSAEEPPAFNTRFMGSRVFVRGLPGRSWAIRAALILEMVGYFSADPGSQQIPLSLKWLGFSDTGDFVAVLGNGASRRLVRDLEASFRQVPDPLPVETLTVPGNGFLLPESRFSDNASFWDAGIPAVMITDTSYYRNRHYHGPSDRPETLDYGAMEKLVRMIAGYLKEEPTGRRSG